MLVSPTAIPGVLVLAPQRHRDDRGFFCETWSARRLAEIGVTASFVQDNQSRSEAAGTVRGLHCQRPPHAQGKLVRVASGRILDVAVDARRGSPTYGRWVGVELSADNGAQLWVPRGCLHGFVTREPRTDVVYTVDDHYAPDCEAAVRFDDPDIGVDWGVPPAAVVLSARDAAAPAFRDFDSPFRYEAAA